jgi:hypothetical protein
MIEGTANGAILSARHSFMPNRLGYCGPDENEVLFEAILQNKKTDGLIKALQAFQGAHPYLRFIAKSQGLDPFDYRVVEAYWIGNDALQAISPTDFYEHLKERLSSKFSKDHIKKFFEARPYAPFPHHALHVFNAFSTMGGVPDAFANAVGPDQEVGRLMDKCRISWGKVVGFDDQKIIVEYEPVMRHEGKLSLGPLTRTMVAREIQGRGFLNDLKQGDWISFHWDFACTVLSPVQAANLRKYTLSDMELANAVPVPE